MRSCVLGMALAAVVLATAPRVWAEDSSYDLNLGGSPSALDSQRADPPPNLVLHAAPGSDYVTGAEQVTVTLEVIGLTEAINGVQALLHYDTAYLSVSSITANAPWQELYENLGAGGNITYATWIVGGSVTTNGVVATLVFDVEDTANGPTNVSFQADGPVFKTKLTRASDNTPIWPGKENSGTMVVDNLAPQITALLVTPSPTTVATVSIAVDATETYPCGVPAVTVTPSGGSVNTATFINEAPPGTYNYTFDVTAATSNGLADAQVSMVDCAGNTGSASTTFFVDTVDPAMAVSNFSTVCAKEGTVVTFDVTVTDPAPSSGFTSNPQVVLTLADSSTRNATYVSGTMPGTLQYSFTIATGDANGSVSVDAGVSDAATNAAQAATVPNAFVIDTAAPTLAVQNVAPPYAKEGTTVTFEVVAADAAPSSGFGGNPDVMLVLADSSTRSATYVSGTVPGTLVYSYTVQAADSNGLVDITADVDDCAGNGAVQGVQTDAFAIDTQAPAIVLGTPAVQQDGAEVTTGAEAYRTTVADSCDLSGYSNHPVTLTFAAQDVTKDGYQSGLNGAPVVAVQDAATNGVAGALAGGYVYTMTVDGTTANGMASYTINVSDLAGNAAAPVGGTFLVNKTQIVATVDLQAVGYRIQRGVEYVVTECGSSVTQTWNRTLCTETNGVGITTLVRVDPTRTWDSIAAREGHTLRRMLDTLTFLNSMASPDFTGLTQLLAGDFHTATVAQDNLVDIVDFSILATNWNLPVNPNLGIGADATGDGAQATSDFTAIQINFFKIGDAADDCLKLMAGVESDGLSGGAVRVQPRGRVSVADLQAFVPQASRADMNADGVIDASDIRAFARRYRLALLPEFDLKLSQMEATSAVATPTRR